MNTLKEKLLASPTGSLWKRIGVYPHHGINIFLPALRTKKSCGIGEFFDLLPIIDWCHHLKMDVIQLLPLNNSDLDPSPYNPMSSCAINFIMLSLHALPFLDQLPDLKRDLNAFAPLNDAQRIPYEDVMAQKTTWLQAYFELRGKRIMQSSAFKEFSEENTYWLESFALFKTLKDNNNNAPCQNWPEDLQKPTQEKYRHLLTLYSTQIAFHSTLQFLCYTQLKEVLSYAKSKAVFLKGDVPILVGRESADVWRHPEFFDTRLAAGAPPDMYYSEGQYWGFPLFQWEALCKDNYQWWKQRLKYASHFFDLFRIDHVIGFFRIWAIPLNTSAKEGHYLPKKETQWETQGKELLQMIISHCEGMMPIAEDLGVVPDALPLCLKEMAICGTKILRWEKYWEKEDQPCIPLNQYPPVSLTSVSTHDSPTLTQWWRDYPEEAQSYARFKKWKYTPQLSTVQLWEILWDSHHTTSLFHINLLQEYLALFPELVWPNPDDERINIPGMVLPENWTYRYRCTVEEITTHPALEDAMQKILFSSTPLPL